MKAYRQQVIQKEEVKAQAFNLDGMRGSSTSQF